jgi:hypothetical protein
MPDAKHIIDVGQRKLRELGAKTNLSLGKPLSEKSLASAERKLEIAFPEDYRRFVLEHGLLSVGSMYKMLDMSELIEHTLDLRDDVTEFISDEDAEELVPFQYYLDERIQQ